MDGPFRKILELQLTGLIGESVFSKSSLAEADSALQLFGEQSCFILCSSAALEQANELPEWLVHHKSQHQVLVIGKSEKSKEIPDVTVLENIGDWNDVVKAVMNKMEHNQIKHQSGNYDPVPASMLKFLGRAPCDLFLAFHRGSSDERFIKRVHQGDQYTESMIQKYVDQGLNYLYVYKEDLPLIQDQLVLALKDYFRRENSEGEFEFLGASFDFATSFVDSIGVKSKAAIPVIQSVIGELATSFVTSDDEVSKKILAILKSRSRLAYKCSHILGVIALQMLKETTWSNTEIEKKIATAAFFHDLTLQKDDWIFITGQGRLDKLEITDEERTNIMEHAQRGAHLVSELKELPIGTDTLILHHHGSRNGIGFPERWDSEVNQVEAVFIIAEDFALTMLGHYLNGENCSAHDTIADLAVKYESKEALQTIELLKNSLR